MVFFNRIRLLFRDESAQAAVDYVLLSMGVGLAAVVAVHGLATQVDHSFLTNVHFLNSAINACFHHHRS